MSVLTTTPVKTKYHPTGPEVDPIHYGLKADTWITNSPVFPSAVFQFTGAGTQQSNGDNLLFADILFDIVNTGTYTSGEINLTGTDAEVQAENFYGAMLSNIEIANRATVTLTDLGGGTWQVSVVFTEYIEWVTFLDETGLSNPPLASSSDSGTVPTLTDGLKIAYQLLLSDGTKVTKVRECFPSLAAAGGENEILLNFAGELHRLCEPTLPSSLTLAHYDQAFLRRIFLRHGNLITTDGETTSDGWATSDVVDVIGAASQLDQDFSPYVFAGNAFSLSGTEDFLSLRPEILSTCLDQYEWFTFILWANRYFENQGTPGYSFDYFVRYTTDNGNTADLVIGAQDGAIIIPVGGANVPVDLTGAKYYRVRIRVNSLDTTPGVFALSYFHQFWIDRECCRPEYRDIYFREPLGSTSCLRFKVVEEKNADQEYGEFYRPFDLKQTKSVNRARHGHSTYDHKTSRRLVMRFESFYTPEVGKFVELFRASKFHAILASESPIVWDKVLLEPGSFKNKREGEKIVVSASFLFHTPVNV